MSARSALWAKRSVFARQRTTWCSMYKIEYDYLRGVWNVLYTHDGQDDYIRSYEDVADAQRFCDINNGALVSTRGK